MGKLNIAHHKSYHPYRRDNIERVRRDEEEAARDEAEQEGRMMLADSEARMDLLRQRAGLAGPKGKGTRDRERDTDDLEQAMSLAQHDTGADTGPSTLTTTSGHFNLFEDLERGSIAAVAVRSTKKPPQTESEKGVALAPSARDLKPWYSDRDHERTRESETGEDKRLRDLARKSVHDPLTAINSRLASRDRPSVAPRHFSARRPGPSARPATDPSSQPRAPQPASAERLTRESEERQRAMELVRRKKREAAGSETPSTSRGGDGGYGYGDVFNRREIEEVRRARRRDRDWDRGRERDRDWERGRDRERDSRLSSRWW